MELLLFKNFTQEQFDKAVNTMQKEVDKGRECNIVEIGQGLFDKSITLVEGYMDLEVDASGAYDAPHFWYNKKELDKRGIKYERES